MADAWQELRTLQGVPAEDLGRIKDGILEMAGLRCPCGHPLDSEGMPDEYGCLNGHIYGPCGDENCYGRCDDTAGSCKGLDGCCDPRLDDD